MNKTKKLLSVILAIVLALSSMTMLASAANKPGTKSVYDWKNVATNDPTKYDQYGRATRFTVDERVSMLFDYLDVVLDKAGIAPIAIPIVGSIRLDITLGSVNEICATFDSITNLLGNWLVKGVIGPTDLSKLNFNGWPVGIRRESVGQQKEILMHICNVLAANSSFLANVVATHNIKLGIVGNFIPIDVNKILTEIPGMLKGFILPLFARWDDDLTRIQLLENINGSVLAVLQDYANGMLTKNVAITTYNEDVNGNRVSGHQSFPLVTVLPEACETRCVFMKEGNDIVRYHWDTKANKYIVEKDVYVRTPEPADASKYFFKRESGENLVWYQDNTPALHSMFTENKDGTNTPKDPAMLDHFNVSTNSIADIFYYVLPYLLEDFGVVAANGSLKKELAWWFGANWGQPLTKEEIAKEPQTVQDFVNKKATPCVYAFSDYLELDGAHYWRYGNDLYKANTENTNDFFNLVNWNYKLDKTILDGINENNQVFQNLNNILGKLVNLVLVPTAQSKDGTKTFTRPVWEMGTNDKLVDNVISVVQALFGFNPAAIFGSNYNRQERYYRYIMAKDANKAVRNQKVLVGAACTLIPMIMPQIILPTGKQLDDMYAAGNTVHIGAILAQVVRELASQLVPEKNYDALIFKNYNTKAYVEGKDNAYWLDVILTIGTDIGFKYLVSVMDIGEDDAESFVGAKWSKNKKDYALGDEKLWEDRLDYLIDWALCDKPYGFGAANMLDVKLGGKPYTAAMASKNLATKENVFEKVESALTAILPNNLIGFDTAQPGWLKKLLVNDLFLAIADLNIPAITNIFKVNTTLSPLCQKNAIKQVVDVVRNLLNNLLKKTLTPDGKNAIELLPSTTITSVDSIFTHKALGSIVGSVLTGLTGVYQHGLHTALPIVQMIIGVKSTGQGYGNPFLKVYDSTKKTPQILNNNGSLSADIEIRNEIAGILLKHGADTDSEYKVTVTGVTNTAGLTLEGALPGPIGNFEKTTIKLKGTYTKDMPVTIVVKYTLTGIDGQQVGKEQELIVYTYIAGADAYNIPTWPFQEQKIQVSGGAWIIGGNREAFPKYQVIHDASQIKNTINNQAYTFKNRCDPWENGLMWTIANVSTDKPEFVSMNQSFVRGKTPRPTAGDAIDATNTGVSQNFSDKDLKDSHVFKLNLYKFNEGTDMSSYAVGPKFIDMGNFKVTMHNDVGTNWIGKFTHEGDSNIDFTGEGTDIYILNDQKLVDAFNKYRSLKRGDFDAQSDALWDTFQNAMAEASTLVLAPFNPATYETLFSTTNVDNKTNDILNAVKALSTHYASAGSASLEAADKETNDPLTNTEYNWQDYDLYEFFKYQGNRNDARWRIGAYKEPTGEYYAYIASNPNLGNDNIQNAIKTAKNQNGVAIKNSLTQPTEDQIKAAAAAKANWKAPAFTEMENDDLAARLRYTQKHLEKLAGDPAKLQAELAVIYNARGKAYTINEGDYSVSTWARLDSVVQDIISQMKNMKNLTRSQIFQLKWDLMTAIRGLVPIELSCQDTIVNVDGAPVGKTPYADLDAAVKEAQKYLNDTKLPKLVANAGMTPEQFLGKLITVTGYVDPTLGQLYPNSGMAMLATDRIWSKNEQTRINNATKAITDLLALVDIEVAIAPTSPENGGKVDKLNKFINGITVGGKIGDTFSIKSVAVDESLVKANAVGVKNGTGAQVVADGLTFTLVVYGDVNGDGAIDGFDAVVLANNISVDTLTDAYKEAADLSGNNAGTNSQSYAILEKYIAGAAIIDQSNGKATVK